MKEKLILTEEGYQQYINEINKLKEKLNYNAGEGSEAIRNAVGDGWHDNFAFEDSVREEKKISFAIQEMLYNLNNIEIIKENKKINKNVININDIIELKLTYPNKETEIGIFKLTGNYITKLADEFQEITINSPLGKAIYHQRIGSSVSYNIDGHKIEVTIIKVVSR